MPYQISTTAAELLALLDNARMLAVRHQNRPFASDVVRACSLYAGKTSFPVDTKMLDKLASLIPDKMNDSLNSLFAEAMAAVGDADYRVYKTKIAKEKSGLPMWSDLGKT
jgi:hypothetical protein